MKRILAHCALLATACLPNQGSSRVDDTVHRPNLVADGDSLGDSHGAANGDSLGDSHGAAGGDSSSAPRGDSGAAPHGDSSAAETCPSGPRPGAPSGTDSFTTPVGTEIIVRTPAGYERHLASPLLVMYSGATFDAARTESDTGLTGPAGAQGYLVAYVDHLIPNSDANIEEAAEAVSEVQARWCVDPERIYLSGHSDGGSMSHLVALRGLVAAAAIAPSASGLRSASLIGYPCMPEPLPVLELHSKDDTMFPVAEGYGGDVAAWFAACSTCVSPPNANAEGCLVYAPCTAGVEVKYCEGEGPHGSWPSLRTQQILEFFDRF